MRMGEESWGLWGFNVHVDTDPLPEEAHLQEGG